MCLFFFVFFYNSGTQWRFGISPITFSKEDLILRVRFCFRESAGSDCGVGADVAGLYTWAFQTSVFIDKNVAVM